MFSWIKSIYYNNIYSSKVGNITNSVSVDGESFNATVEVINKTDNKQMMKISLMK